MTPLDGSGIPLPRHPGDDLCGGGGERADRWTTAWAQALAEMELDVQTAEQLLHEAHRPQAQEEALARPPWVPPVGLGPLPASLQTRAQALLDRQLEVARRTATSIGLGRRHAAAAEAMRPRSGSVPVYIDTET